MSSKFIRRTLRNVVLRNHPYFAHLALTHRCNLRCRFCHIQETQFEELDTAGMQRAIDVLDRIGVGVLSISGGGEPLLRNDFDTIINYAASKGLYTKITSNGTMPLERYDRLLASGIREISISLDGVEGNDLPFSHTAPAILRTIRHLHGHLPAGKQLTLNVTVTDSNRTQVPRIVSYCAHEYPNAKVWLNPVVTGNGKLRSLTQIKVDPAAAEACNSPTLLRAPFYDAGVREQYQREVYDWGCRAGELFFDVKPNGDVWACQDQPARQPLNVLEPDFAQKLRDTDFRYRRECSGCTYSCYYITQKGLEPRNWPDMAGLWWTANTHPGDTCRQVAERNGWLAGLLSFCTERLARTMASAAVLLLMVSAAANGGAAPPPQDPGEVVARMEQTNDERRQRLEGFECVRTYKAGNETLRRQAEVTADFRFGAPAHKEFRIRERRGSKPVQLLVIEPLIAAETDSAKVRRDVDIARRNYDFRFAMFDDEARVYVFQVQPRTVNPYLFRGTVWIDAETFAVRRIEGEPAKSPSFWVKRSHFVHEYAPLGEFWLPVRLTSEAELRIFGRAHLSITYAEYRLTANRSVER